ncbi:hypothetical protein GGX14DRAFT_607429 [Mycena pura]|uniref:Uncharacterized protein n=1 Tax=Mycena pura TaxID=153505 RepID=A0AAD6XZK9_9AGAR|nr:hypothetical protein GGX14DRAFT_607429 [Mycena pura]
MPSTLSQTEQQVGQAARLPGAIGRAVILVQKSDIKKAKKYMISIGRSSAPLTQLFQGRKKQTKPTPEYMDLAKAEILVETTCLNAARNRRWKNTPLNEMDRDCITANRPLPSFSAKLFESEMYTDAHQRRVKSWFFPVSLQEKLIDGVLRLTTSGELNVVLENHDWPFCSSAYRDELWLIITNIQVAVASACNAELSGSRKHRAQVMETESDNDSEMEDVSRSLLPPTTRSSRSQSKCALEDVTNEHPIKVRTTDKRVSMSSVWLIRELFGWGHWTWRWGNSQRCEKVDYQDWSPYQPRRAPSMVINRRYTMKESIQLKGELTISEGSCAEYHVMASGTRTHGVEIRIQANG